MNEEGSYCYAMSATLAQYRVLPVNSPSLAAAAIQLMSMNQQTEAANRT
jgi:hypothetical protein